MEENKDYELTPGNHDHWNIRILTGEYVETVFNFGAIKVSDDGESLNYSSEIISHQFGEDWNPDSDLSWHETTGNILLDILEQNMQRLENEDTDNGSTGER